MFKSGLKFYFVATLASISMAPLQAVTQEPATPAETATSWDNLPPGNYVDTDYENKGPNSIAIIYVEDARASKEDDPDLRKHFARGLLVGLGQRKYRRPTPLDEAQEKLIAGGLSGSAADNPSTDDACRILGADALMRVKIKDRAEKEVVIAKGVAAQVQASLQDCQSRKVLWSFNGIVSGSVGWIMARSNYAIAESLATWTTEGIPKRPKRK